MGLFNKKTDVLPLLKGLVDIHCHVLPGIDDGAADVEQSLKLLQEYKALGFAGVIATPHILEGAYPNTAETIEASFDRLQEELAAHGLADFIKGVAAEHMLDERTLAMLKEYLEH